MRDDDAPHPNEIAVDPELAILHALRVQLRMTADLLVATLHDMPDPGVIRRPIDSEVVARLILTRAADLSRWIQMYQRVRRSETAP